jgi:PHD/YefM family antitoxin component YafN of YafNO toxin-antitoxin module
LKNKDVYVKEDDIKYDWYFYLRVSIIILVFFNFALYIYNISKDPSINPKKTGGGPAFSKRNNKVAPDASVDNKIKKIEILKQRLNPLINEYKEGLKKITITNNNQDSNKITENSQFAESIIAPLRKKIEKISAELKKLQGESTVAKTSRAESRASNKVLPVRFPYQEPANQELTIKDIMNNKELTASQKTALWSQLNKQK